jgi:hypothetical protein
VVKASLALLVVAIAGAVGWFVATMAGTGSNDEAKVAIDTQRAETSPTPPPEAPKEEPVSEGRSRKPVPEPAQKASAEAPRLVGCWGTASSPGRIVVNDDHGFTSGGVIAGRWYDVSGSIFQMRFPDDAGQARLSNDGRSLSLTGKVTSTLVRPDTGSSIVGEWKFADGPLPATFAADGSFRIAAVVGKWRETVDAGVFVLVWPGANYTATVNSDNQSMTMSDPAYGSTTLLQRFACAR